MTKYRNIYLYDPNSKRLRLNLKSLKTVIGGKNIEK